jgi:hypothetical protein
MRSISFNVRPGVGKEEQAALFHRLSQIPGIHRAAPLSPNSKNPAVRRMGYAYVTDDANIDALCREIAQCPEIESASVPADRYLAQS